MTLTVKLRHAYARGKNKCHRPTFELDVEFEAAGPVTALYGPSGSGKTTIVNAIAGLITPYVGTICIGGRTLLDTATATALPVHRRRIGYVFQDACLFPHLNVSWNLLFGRWFNRKARSSFSLEQVTGVLGIPHLLQRMPDTLSGGERQRVAIGRALLANPAMLLLDEPLSSLDDERRETILPILERIRDELHIPMVYVSHNRDEITRLADEVVRIDSGRVTGIERRALQSRQSQAQNRWHLRAIGSKESPGDHRTNASLTACGGVAPSESPPEQRLGSRGSKRMLQVPRAVTSSLEH